MSTQRPLAGDVPDCDPGDLVPSVSVLVPVFNGEITIAAAIESALSQSFTDVEVVVVDDGSTDATPAVLAHFDSDQRVRIHRHDSNCGLVASLATGLALCRGSLVARLDADDVALPGRLERQVSVFNANPEVVLCATAYERVNEEGVLGHRPIPPLTHGALAMAMAAGNQLCHSSVMFRRSVVEELGGYDATWFPVEDYDLWLRLLERGLYVGLAEPGVRFLENPVGISAVGARVQAEMLATRSAHYRLAIAGTRKAARGVAGRVRNLEHFRRALTIRLEHAGVARVGVDSTAYRMAFDETVGLPRVVRHLIVGAVAPMLWLKVAFKPRRSG